MSTDGTFNPPRGMRDFYPEDMALRNTVFDAWRAAACHHGFLQYDASVVESLDLLKRKSGEEIVNQIYAFTDKSGRELALRPEMTPTLARMIAARQGALQFPVKWFTIAQCFRYERMSLGRKREHYQWNLDIIGEDSVAAEVEVLGTAADALRELGLDASRIRIHFSSRALLGDLLERLGIAREHHAAVFLALDKRGKVSDDEITALLADAKLDPALIRKAFDLLAIATLDDAARFFDQEPPSLATVRRFLSLAGAAGIADLLVFDISVIRGLTYYTGIVFEAFDTARKFRAVFGGGRYDDLLSDIGGKPMSGVGLGFGDVVVAELMTDAGVRPAFARPETVAVGFMDDAQQHAAITLAARLRGDGTPTDLATRHESPKSFFGRASKSGFGRAVYIGPDDVARGTVRVKDLTTRTETEMKLA